MPNVMIREQNGTLTGYIAKKDLEAEITSIEFTDDDKWGGKITLINGTSFYFDPLSAPPTLPITIRMRRG